MTALQHLHHEVAQAALAAQFGCPAEPSAVASSLAADHIRATLHGTLTARGHNAVHTSRVLSNARRAVNLMWPSEGDGPSTSDRRKDYCADILDRLETIGDAWCAGSGQWITTPVRFVGAASTARLLVVGSAPTPLVRQRFNAELTCAGPSRYASPANLGDQAVVQSVDAWLGDMPALSSWTMTTIESADARMHRIDGLSAEQLEAYAPDILRTQRRPGRWIKCDEIGRAVDGIRLCRPLMRYSSQYDRPYYLARFSFGDGALALACQAQIPHSITLRLRFGLDTLLKTPRSILIEEGRTMFVIAKPPKLPDPEARVLSLGWRDRNVDSDHLTFHRNAMPFLKHAFSRLSIEAQIEQMSMS